MTLFPILRRIQRPTTQGHSSHAKYENSRKIETCRNNHFQRIHYPCFGSTYRRCWKWWPSTCKHLLIHWWKDSLTSAKICGVNSVHARRILSFMSSGVVGATVITRSLTKPSCCIHMFMRTCKGTRSSQEYAVHAVSRYSKFYKSIDSLRSFC